MDLSLKFGNDNTYYFREMNRINKIELELQKEKLEEIRLKNIAKQIENDKILANKIQYEWNKDFIVANDHIIATELTDIAIRNWIAKC